MNNKILNLVKQMSEREKQSLFDYIKRQYALKEKTGMLRDDIKDKVFDLINSTFVDPKFMLQEHHTWVDITMDAEDVIALSEMIMIEFELDSIDFSEVMKWQTLKDVITYIEEALECALHDMKDS